MSTQGNFVWYELMTKAPDAALKFYGELFGWKYHTGEMGPMKYHEIMVGERPIGGITGTMSPDQPSAWHAYVTVENVDVAAERATKTGGQVQMPPMDIPGTGRFAMLADPSGAVIAPFTYTAEEPSTPEVQGEPGTFVWNQLMTADLQGAQRFYSEVFGWSMSVQQSAIGPYHSFHHGSKNVGKNVAVCLENPCSPGSSYQLFHHGGKDVDGMMKKLAEVPARWLYYVGVADVDAVHKKALALGAKQLMEPVDFPGMGYLSGFTDPAGAMLSLFKVAAR